MLRIKSLIINEHTFLEGIPFEFTNPAETEMPNYYSVIIGPNGTGKSNILSFLIEVFNDLALMKGGYTTKSNKQFSLQYELNGVDYLIHTSGSEVQFVINGYVASVTDVLLPLKWLAVSVTINDKFPILQDMQKELTPQYSYLGIRSARNNAFVGNIRRNVIISFIDALRAEKNELLAGVYEKLGLRKVVSIQIGPGIMLDKNVEDIKNSTIYKIVKKYDSKIGKQGTVKSYRAEKYLRFRNDKDLVTRVNQFLLRKSESLNARQKFNLIYDLALDDIGSVRELLADWDIIKIMIDVELLKVEQFMVYKDSGFQYEEASSGENHLLFAFHGIIANVDNNSLVLIDEPEISLHPNWQLAYMEIIKSIIDMHTGVNVIISTHSHFIVSGLKQEESRIIALKRNAEGSISATPLDYETFTWSPDEILYKIFGLRTNRNTFFESDLLKLAYLLNNNSREFGEVREIIEKLESFKISPEDPLTMLIEKANEYLRLNHA